MDDGARQGRRLRAERNFRGTRAGIALLTPPQTPTTTTRLTPQTCSWSLRSRPSSWGRRVRPGPGAAACGVQRLGPRAGPGVPGPGRGRGAAGRGRSRGGETSRLRRGLLHLPQSRRRRRLLVASSSLSSASTSTQNKNTPHLPATPLLIGQSRPGPGTAWGGEEEERAAAAAARDHPSPTPGRSPRLSAREQPERGGGGASRLLPPSHASPPREGEEGKCLSVCVYLCIGGAVGRV